VRQILGELGIDPEDGERLIEVWNKADLLGEADRERLANLSRRGGRRPVLVSAVTGEGLEALSAEIAGRLTHRRRIIAVSVEAADGQALSWAYQHAEVLERRDDPDGPIRLTLRVTPEKLGLALRRFPDAVAAD
jgi:GTP-binding protein HflX